MTPKRVDAATSFIMTMTMGRVIRTKTAEGHVGMRTVRLISILVLSFVVTSCANSAQQTKASGPDGVALAYVQAMLSNDYVAAQLYIAPGDMQSFRLLTTGVPPGRLEGIGLHSETKPTSGTDLIVVMLGTLCKVAQGTLAVDKSSENPDRRCIENRDPVPTRSNLAFQVHLVRLGNSWRVRIPLAGLVQP